MSKEKFLTIAVVFLFLLNAGLIAYLMLGRPARPPELWRLVSDRAGFDDAQVQQYMALRDEHRQGMIELDDAFASVLRQYLAQLKSPPDAAQETSLTNQLAELEKKKAEHTLAHFRKVRALCRPEQLEKFDALVPELMRILLPPKRPEPGRGNRK